MSVQQEKLDDLCSLIADCPHSTPKWTTSGVIVLRNQNIKNGRLDLSSPSFTDEINYQDRTRRATPTFNDIVITREAPMGDVCLIPNGLKCCLGQRQVLIRPNPNLVNPQFLLYAFQSEFVQNQIRWNEGTGSTVSNLRIPELKKLKIPVFDLHLQHKIARTLGALDDKIELNRQMNATLEATARALFKAWFVDFEPVRANSENRPSESASPEIAKHFPSEFENGIPKGWRIGKLGEVLEAKGGTTPSTKQPKFWNGENFWATPKDLSNLQFPVLLTTERRITDEGVKQISSGVLPKGTLLLSSRAPIGYVAISQIPVSINQGFIAIQGKTVSNLFLLHWLGENMEAVKSRANGSTFQEISKSNFREIQITAPSSDLSQRFDNFVNPLFEKIVINNKENQKLEEIRDSLLPRLISGKIRVGEAESLTAEVA